MAAGVVMNFTLSGHIIVMTDPCIVGVEIKIYRFDVITMV